MRTLPVLPGQAASSRPSPVEVRQILLSQLPDRHYGLTLNDTPFTDGRVTKQHIEAGISLYDVVNFFVEKCVLVRTDQLGFNVCTRPRLIDSIDILQARRITGLVTRSNYRTVDSTTLGRCPEVK